ncbi:MAG TPA: diapolycopene oxygenase [Deltaproteobacteria bacterium]|nr:diapolycopene oxygenase [Deltaproteobacteria bacterium]HCP45492.1 diapolycopene oxygenase [Deltaproteobacteria bacterium]
MTKPESVIVVGGGLGGLSVAAGLAARGVQVRLFEANDKLGGKLNLLEAQGFVFDLGPSIFILPDLYRQVFTTAGRRMEDYIEFTQVEPQWRSFFEDGTQVDLRGDDAAMRAELERLGGAPGDWERFTHYSERLWNFAQEHYLDSRADSVMDILKSSGLLSAFRNIEVLSSMHKGVRRRIGQPHLAEVLEFFIKYVGSSAHDAPALMNLLAWAQLRDGLYYVPGGMYGYARALTRLLEELGVEIHLNTPIRSMDKQGSRVTSVTTEDGQVFRADAVVSNMEVVPTYERLLREPAARLRRYKKDFAPAASGLVMHLGVSRCYDQLAHHNFFFSRDPQRFFQQIHRDKVLPDDPTIYLVYPTRTDPERAPEGHSIVKILPHVPPLGETPLPREAYMDLRERVLDKLERMGLEGLREHTVFEHTWTPHDIAEQYGSYRGAIYGVVSDRRRNFAVKAPRKSGYYENLWFVGGTVNPGGGTPMVLLGGQQVAELMTGDASVLNAGDARASSSSGSTLPDAAPPAPA